jgi:flagellar protein FlbT
VALKIELKPNERVMLGDCVVTNHGQRTRLVIEGKVPILRETDIMKLSAATTPAKRLYLAVQFMYMAKAPQEHYALYLRLAHELLKLAPQTASFMVRINNRILTGDLYKALKEARKLVDYETEHPEMAHAAEAYAKVATETASPRELEASLLLKAAAKLQAVHESWQDRPTGLDDAILYNRRLWTIFVDAVGRDDNKLPATVRRNLLRLGLFIMGETYSLMTEPKPEHLRSIISINRGIAAGLRGKA